MGGLTAPSRAPLSAFNSPRIGKTNGRGQHRLSRQPAESCHRWFSPRRSDPVLDDTIPNHLVRKPWIGLAASGQNVDESVTGPSRARRKNPFFLDDRPDTACQKFLSPMSPHPATKADFLAYGQRSHHSERLWLETPAGAEMGEADRGGGAGVLRPLRRLHSSRRSVRPRSFIRSQLLPRPVPSWMQSGGAEQAPTEEPRRCSPS
jgi:hypothetical protein